MSVRMMARVWDRGPEDRDELLVLLALADFADDEGFCYPSMPAIAAKARMTERGVRGILRRLEASGWVTTERGGGKGRSSRYRVNPDPPSHAQPGTPFPEPHSRNAKPGMPNPEWESTKPGTARHQTRNQGSGKPSVTIKNRPPPL
ncbi:helix-turn-helix domain-containing protein [Rubellimicrobium sp. CFH 75288]|uniref:helix-turn-helix domain-containing protein n=1 Tax=Rubellimicrobium sp. CFH 75288 TaxID=2697034 RepID=UPI001412C28A|nr:hypothetical protein [Rubellimicrobium sp. CFH 75288]